jgi:1-acyl-sn-glycerol-3-phosphate acyltransferase
MLITASRYLSRHCSVMFFPEGTRSPDGRVGRFTDGAFALAVKAQVPILPVAIDGSRDCLPKRSWRFGPPQAIKLRVLPPVATNGMTMEEVASLREKVRGAIIAQVAEWRGESLGAVDGQA